MNNEEIKKIKKQMEDAVETKWNSPKNRIRCPRLKKMAEYINTVFPHLTTTIEPWSESKDRRLGRLRSPGKMYYGSKLIVVSKISAGRPIFEHETTETYRTNTDVARFILKQEEKMKKQKG